MKAATGELNLAVLVIIAVAVMSAFFFTVIWPNLRDNQHSIMDCRRAVCNNTSNGDGTVTCWMGQVGNGAGFPCTWKG